MFPQLYKQQQHEINHTQKTGNHLALGFYPDPMQAGRTSSGGGNTFPNPNLTNAPGMSSSSPGNPSSTSTASNLSPNSGSTTLVGVLKRHSSTTPNSTVKKRVQIQEISV